MTQRLQRRFASDLEVIQSRRICRAGNSLDANHIPRAQRDAFRTPPHRRIRTWSFSGEQHVGVSVVDDLIIHEQLEIRNPGAEVEIFDIDLVPTSGAVESSLR